MERREGGKGRWGGAQVLGRRGRCRGGAERVAVGGGGAVSGRRTTSENWWRSHHTPLIGRDAEMGDAEPSSGRPRSLIAVGRSKRTELGRGALAHAPCDDRAPVQGDGPGASRPPSRVSSARSAGKQCQAAKLAALPAIPCGPPGALTRRRVQRPCLPNARSLADTDLGGGEGSVEGSKSGLPSIFLRVRVQSASCGTEVYGAPARQSSALESTHPRRVESTRSTWLNKWRGQEVDFYGPRATQGHLARASILPCSVII